MADGSVLTQRRKDAKSAEANWPMVRLGDVCEVVLGGTPSTKVECFWNGAIPWLTPGDMGKRKSLYVSETSRNLTPKGLESGSSLFPAGSVIVSTRAPIGYIKINTVPMCTNQGCKTLVPSDRVMQEYLAYNLIGRGAELNALGTGTTFKELATGVLKSIRIPLPPLAVQREIVARLEKELGEAEKVAAGFRRIAEKAETEFKAELNETFKALEDDASRGGAETRRVRLGDVCETITDGDWIESKDQSSDGIRLIQTGNIGDGIFEHKNFRARYISEETFQRLHCTEIFEGDILVSRLPEPVGRACVVENVDKRMITAVDCTIVRFGEIIDSRYFVAYSQSCRYRNDIGSLVTGSTRPRISRKNLESVPIPLPTLPVQRSIVARLDAARERCGRLKSAAERGLRAAENLRKAILKEAFHS